jgi:hypothetical protein
MRVEHEKIDCWRNEFVHWLFGSGFMVTSNNNHPEGLHNECVISISNEN